MTAPPTDGATPRDADRPTLVYDADCGFCVRCVQHLRERTGERVEYVASRDVGTRFAHVPGDEFTRAIFFFEPSGRTSRAAEAALRALAASPGLGSRVPLGAYRVVPGLRLVLERLYAFVARHRLGISRVVTFVAGPDVGPSRWLRSRRVFLFALGLVALIAMLSIRSQIVGLAGTGGVLPAAHALVATPDWLRAPTWLWLDASDDALLRLCDIGIAGAVLLMLNIVPALGALALWSVALSFVVGVPGFFSYQWDALLVETCFVAVLYAPWHLFASRRRAAREPSGLARWLLWFVLFRLMYASGIVKLASEDPSWSSLTALHHHYLTQPLPHVASWFMEGAHDLVHRAGAAFVFLAELVLPFTILLPRRLRHAGAVGMLALQVLIFATGNFGWFNLLAIALCLSLFDDQAFTRRRRDETAAHARAPIGSCGLVPVELPAYRTRRPTLWPQRATILAAALVLAPIGALHVAELHGTPSEPTREQYDAGLVGTLVDDGPAAATRLLRFHARPFRSANTYGLFAIMTTERPEIRVQVADDQGMWHDVPFRHKPFDARRAPTWSQPLMPRLDWQMWFEALAWQRAGLRFPYQPSAWFVGFLDGLAEARPAVHALLAEPPLAGEAPAAIRIRLEYARFTTFDELASSGDWWVFDGAQAWITTWER